MTPDYTIKRHDAGKVISGQLLDSSGTASDWTGASSSKIYMTSIAGGTPKINGATFTFSAPTTANWTYTMLSGDVDTSGWYKLELEVVKSGATYTFPTDPNTPYLLVLIQDDLG